MDRSPPVVRSHSSSTVGADVSFHNLSPDQLIHDPLSCGFLLKHCKEQFSDENMLFIVAVDRFRDYLGWPKTSWKRLDEEHLTVTPETETIEEFVISLQDPNFFAEDTWPSTIVSRDSVREVISKIISQFLMKDSDKWICVSQGVLANTIKRIRLLHIYGQEVFSEALFDPVRTIERDIYPRFLSSPHYRRMLETKQLLEKKAYMEKLRLPKPERHIQNKYTKQQLQTGKVCFTLNEIVEDGTLYEEFMKYLESVLSEENLKCMQALAIYKESFLNKSRDGHSATIDFAVLVYRYFVAPRAPCEISISHMHVNEILRGLAEPYPTLFDPVERSAWGTLQTHFNSFRNTAHYANLSKVLLSQAKLPAVITNSNSGSVQTGHRGSATSKTGAKGELLHVKTGSNSALPNAAGLTPTHHSILSNGTNNNNNNFGTGKSGRPLPATLSSSSSAPAVGMRALFGTCFPSVT